MKRLVGGFVALLLAAGLAALFVQRTGTDEVASGEAPASAAESAPDVAETAPDVVETAPAAAETAPDEAVAAEADDAPEAAPVVEAPVAEAPPAEEPSAPETIATAEPAPESDAEPAASAPALETPQAEAPAPSIDLLRVEEDGSAVLAGRSQPNETVSITVDDEVVAEVTASDSGEFVALLDTGRSETARELGVTGAASAEGGEGSASAEPMILLPNRAETDDAAEPPLVVRSTERGAEIVSPPPPSEPGAEVQVGIDLITYSDDGDDVILGGRGTPGRDILLYVDGEPSADAVVGDDGRWEIALSFMAEGFYTLRVDQIGPDGAVLSRAETPFQRVVIADAGSAAAGQAANAASGEGTEDTATAPASPEAAPETSTAEAGGALAASTAPPLAPRIVVQPGNNLWTIARTTYGEGTLYTQIFEANSDQIRDPDLIYPGQVFELPRQED